MTTNQIAFAVAVLIVCWLLVLVIRFSSVNERIPAMVETERPTVHPSELMVHPSELEKGDLIRVGTSSARYVEVESIRWPDEVWIVQWYGEDGAGESSTYPDDARVPLAHREE